MLSSSKLEHFGKGDVRIFILVRPACSMDFGVSVEPLLVSRYSVSRLSVLPDL